MTSLHHVCFVAPHAYLVLAKDAPLQLVGGAEIQQCLIAKHLVKRGYRISMICLDFGQPDDLVISGIRIVKAHKPDEGLPVLRFVHPRLTSIWQAMKRVNAEIYYQRTAAALTGLVAMFCRLNGKKMIYSAASDSDFISGKQRIHYRRDRLIYQWGLKHSDLIIAQSTKQQRLCKKNYNRDSIYIRSCCELSSNASNDEKDFDVLWVSTIKPNKRPEIFLQLARKLPDLSFKMVGGSSNGNNWEPYFCQIKEQAAGISNLEFVGFVPYEEIDRYFNTSRIFVNTSEYEGFPNTFLQSWVRGIPTVSFINPEAVIKGQQVGVVVNSIDKMILKIKELIVSVHQYAAVGDICKEYVGQFHSIEKIVDEYSKVFTSLTA